MKKKFLVGALAALACSVFFVGCDLTDMDLLKPVSPPGSNPEASTRNNVQGAAKYLESMYKDQNVSVRKDYTVISSVKYGKVVYPIEWSVDVKTGVTVVKGDTSTTINVDETLATALEYVLTATVIDPDNAAITAKVSFKRTVEAVPAEVPSKITSTPAENKAYKFHVYHVGNQEDRYLTGELNSASTPWYLKTSNKYDDAIDFFVEYVSGKEGKFYLYHNGLDGATKTYLNAYKTSDNHISNFYETEADMAASNYDGQGKTEWNYDATYGTIVTTINNKEDVPTTYYLGCDATYTTVSPQDTSENKGCLIAMQKRDEIPADTMVEQTIRELTMPSIYIGGGSLELATMGNTFPEVSIRWELVSGTGASVAGNALTFTAPTANTTITVKAIASVGTTTSEKSFSLKAVPNTTDSILNTAFALKEGESFANNVTLTGVITAIDEDGYDDYYGSITVTMNVNGKLLDCFRLKGTGANLIQKGYTITVTGILTNYKGTIQFAQGCSLDSYVEGDESDIPPTETLSATEIMDIAEALGADAETPTEYTLSGKVTEIVKEYSDQYKNITVIIKVDGDDKNRSIECYRIKGDGAATLAVGDTITVTGKITNYKGEKIEFVQNSSLDNVVKGQGGSTTPDQGDSITAITAKPVADQAYTLFMEQTAANKTVYFVGGTSSADYRLKTSDKISEAVDVFVEYKTDSSDLFYLYYLNGSTKTYLNLVSAVSNGNTYINVNLQTSQGTSAWYYSSTYSTIACDFDGATYILGTRSDKTFTDIEAKKATEYDPIMSFLSIATEDGTETPDTPTTPDQGDSITAITAKPVADQAYTLFMEQTAANKTVYFVGGTSSADYRLKTSDKISEAVDVFVEYKTDSSDLFYLYYLNGSTKTYLNLVSAVSNGNTYINVNLQDTQGTSAWYYSSTYSTIACDFDGATYILGTRSDKTFTDIEAKKATEYDPIMSFLSVATEDDTETPDTPVEPEKPVEVTSPFVFTASSIGPAANQFGDKLTVQEFGNILTITPDAGSNANSSPALVGQTAGSETIRVYKNNIFTISCASGYKITSIVFNTQDANGGISSDTVTLTNATFAEGGTSLIATLTPTDGTKAISFTVKDTIKHVRITSITITFEKI